MELLADRGVLPLTAQDQKKFLHPTINNELDPNLLDHME